jgi:hypoxanthine phosphoribosyltransferase
MSQLKPLFTADQLHARIAELGAQIASDYAGTTLILVGVLKGSLPFLTDLMRQLGDLDVRLEIIGVKSYEGTSTTGEVRITHDLTRPLAGQHVLLVEDIVDTGLTLRFLTDLLAARGPASLKLVTLLDKPERRRVPIEANYVGFTIPDRFVVGYGLDLDERLRQLPYVAVYHP